MDHRYDIEVHVETDFVPEQSDPANSRFVFSYTITITNTGSVTTQLLSRRWHITDANGKVQDVEGEGVVGEQPELPPGQGFRYTSGAVIETPVGAMQGAYLMRAEDGVEYEAEIEAFTLAQPGLLH